MAKYDELPVYKASYDLLLEIFRFTKEFNREFKYTVGESLKNETLELITLIYRANSKEEKLLMHRHWPQGPANGGGNADANPLREFPFLKHQRSTKVNQLQFTLVN